MYVYIAVAIILLSCTLLVIMKGTVGAEALVKEGKAFIRYFVVAIACVLDGIYAYMYVVA